MARWVNSAKFDGLYEDPDPLVAGGSRTFTVQAAPVRKRYLQLPAFVRTRGGGYFFVPGLSALRYLANLGASSDHAEHETGPAITVKRSSR